MAIEVCGYILGQLIAQIVLAEMFKKLLKTTVRTDPELGPVTYTVKETYLFNLQPVVLILTIILAIVAIIFTKDRKVSRTYGEAKPEYDDT